MLTEQARAVLKPDLSDIERTLAVLHPRDSGHTYEVRALNCGRVGTISGYFRADENDKAAKLVAALTARAEVPAVYVTLNPTKDELYARAPGLLVERAKQTTSDPAIAKRTALLLDFDPRRESGISSTDAEHDAAVNAASRAANGLLNVGFTLDNFLVADSGNGGHIILACELPNTTHPPDQNDPSKDLVVRFLRAMKKLYATDLVEVDQTTFNAARISKIYGSVSRKGFSTPERPHRLAKIIVAQDRLIPASLGLLESIAVQAPEPEQARARSSSSGTYRDSGEPFVLRDWLIKVGLYDQVKSPKSWNGGELFEFKQCPYSTAHASGAWVAQYPNNGPVASGCRHNTCLNENWHTLRAKYDPKPSTNHADFEARRNGKGPEHEKSQAEEEPEPDFDELTDKLAPVDRFDPKILPPGLRDRVIDCARRGGYAIEFEAVTHLGVIASQIGGQLAINVDAKNVRPRFPTIWPLLIGDSGSGKSPAQDDALNALRVCAREASQNYQQERAAYRQQMREWLARTADRKKIERSPAESRTADDWRILNAPEPQRPIRRQFITNNATQAALVAVLAQLQTRYPTAAIMLHRDELFGLLMEMTEFGHKGDRAFFNQAFDAKPYEPSRVKYLEAAHKNPDDDEFNAYVPRLQIFLMGGVPPHPLLRFLHKEHTEGLAEDGFPARFLMVWPDRPPPSIDAAPDEAAAAEYESIIKGLARGDLADRMPGVARVVQDGIDTAFVRFCPDAQRIYDDWKADLDQKCEAPDEPTILKSHFRKYPFLFGTMALVYHVCCFATGDLGKDGNAWVGVAAATFARRFCKWAASHARRTYTAVLAGPEADAETAGRMLFERAVKAFGREPFTAREVRRNRWAGLSAAKQVETAISAALSAGLLVRVRIPSAPKRGAPTKKYRVNSRAYPRQDDKM